MDRQIVEAVVKSPQERRRLRLGRVVVQSIVEMDDKLYLVRVVLDTDRDPAEIVTAYRVTDARRVEFRTVASDA